MRTNSGRNPRLDRASEMVVNEAFVFGSVTVTVASPWFVEI